MIDLKSPRIIIKKLVEYYYNHLYATSLLSFFKYCIIFRNRVALAPKVIEKNVINLSCKILLTVSRLNDVRTVQ